LPTQDKKIEHLYFYNARTDVSRLGCRRSIYFRSRFKDDPEEDVEKTRNGAGAVEPSAVNSSVVDAMAANESEEAADEDV
jgi:hypothetical protein